MNKFMLLFLTVSFVSTADRMGRTPSCVVRIDQPKVLMSQPSSHIILPCDVNVNCSDTKEPFSSIQPLWFVFNEHSVDPVALPTQSTKYSLEHRALKIHSLQTNDSGVYHCAIVLHGLVDPGAQEIGRGTTLVIRGRPGAGHTLLWSVLVLLALYSLVVVILIILKKSGKDITICRGTRMKCDEKNSVTRTKRTQFRAVVQELYSRKKTQKCVHSSQTKVQVPQFNTPTDDTYQNL